MELTGIWYSIAPYLGGVTLGGVIGMIALFVLKSSFSKVIAEKNSDKHFETVCNKTVEKIKTISFKQNIQPIVESELKKITETANNYIEKNLKETQTKYDKLVNILEKLACYFDNSVGVPEDAKIALRDAIKLAKDEKVDEEFETEPIVISTEKKDVKTTSIINTDIDR